jgi:hypothetical protein
MVELREAWRVIGGRDLEAWAMAEREITQDEAEALQDDPDVVEVVYNDSPTDVADKFVEVLARISVDVEELVPPPDFPSIFYRIGRGPDDAARLRALVAAMAEDCREALEALDEYGPAEAPLGRAIAGAEAEMNP